ncbi:MAG: hypothetical protein IVW36_12405 [Dehalococcoidia bacterium]|nr:hypothetical protein [Dehalococcoidia bacterium]
MTARRLTSVVFAWLFAFAGAVHRDEHGWSPLPDFKGIANAIGKLIEDIKNGWDTATGWIPNFWAAIANGFRDIINPITGFAQWVGAVATNTLNAIASSIGGFAQWVGAVATNTLNSIASNIGGFAQWVGGVLTNILVGIGGSISGFAQWVGAVFTNILLGIANNVSGFAQWVGSAFTNILLGIAKSISDFFQAVGSQIGNGISAFAGAVGDHLGRIGDSVVGLSGTIETATTNIAGDIGSAVETGFEDVLRFLVSHPELVSPLLVLVANDDLSLAVRDGLRFGGKKADQFAADAFQQMLDLFIGTGHLEPAQAREQIAQALGVATAFGLAAQVPGIIQGAIPFENATATKELAGFLAKFAGWEKLIEAGLGVGVGVALARPMEQLLNQQTTTQIPQERELDELLSRRKINPADYTEFHSRHGYTDTWTAAMLAAAYHPARVFEIARVMQFSDIAEPALQSMLEDAGYRPEVTDVLRPAMKTLAMNASITKLVDNAWTAYRDGFIDDAAFEQHLSDAGKRDAEITVLKTAAKLAYTNAQTTEIVAAIRSAAGRGAMSDEEQQAALAQWNVTGGKALVEVARAHYAQLKKPVNNTAAAQTKAVNATRTTLTTAYKKQFAKGLIDAEQLHTQLVAIGVADTQAAAIVTLAQAEVAPAAATDKAASPAAVAARVQKELKAAYVTQFQHGAIDAQTLGAQLLAVGFTTAETESIVALEEAKAIPKPTVVKTITPDVVNKQVSDTLAKAYEEQYAKGLIDADTLEADLIAVGMDPQVAHATRLLDEAKATKKSAQPQQ